MNETLEIARSLGRLRVRSLGNWLKTLGNERPFVLGLGAPLTLAAMLVLGHLAAPTMLAAPTDITTGSLGTGAARAKGIVALEVAFWLALFVAAVTSFRVMELLYRRSDLRAVEAYPIPSHLLFADRLAAALFEALVGGVTLSLFFVPLVWHGGGRVGLLAGLVLVAGLVTSALASFCVQVYAGVLNARAARRTREEEGQGYGPYGGPGQVFMFSPGAALAASAVSTLLVRLAVGELLGPGGGRAFGAVAALLAIASVVALVASFRQFRADFPHMSARFREADAVQYDPPVDYQQSAYLAGVGLESVLPDVSVPSFRALSLQYGRGHALARYSYVIAWILGGLALAQWSRQAFPPWAVVSATAAVAATAANPWFRLVRPPLRPSFDATLPLPKRGELAAVSLLAVRELVVLVAPYAAFVVWTDLSAGHLAAAARASAALFGPLALQTLVAVAWRLSGPSALSAFAVPLAGCVGVGAVAIVSVPVASVLFPAVAIAAIPVVWPSTHRGRGQSRSAPSTGG